MSGRTWTVLGKGIDFPVSMEALTGIPMLPAIDALSTLAQRLGPEVVNAGVGSPRFGKIIQSSAQAEMGLYVDEGLFTGVTIALKCKPLAEEVQVTIASSSKFRRGLIWGSLGLGVVLGLLGVQGFDWDPQLKLALGLLGGAAIGVGLMMIFARIFTANERSQELTAQLTAQLRPILEDLTD